MTNFENMTTEEVYQKYVSACGEKEVTPIGKVAFVKKFLQENKDYYVCVVRREGKSVRAFRRGTPPSKVRVNDFLL